MPIFFYLFPDGDDFTVVEMTDAEAVGLWKQGQYWVDVPKSTRADAEELRQAYLAQPKPPNN